MLSCEECARSGAAGRWVEGFGGGGRLKGGRDSITDLGALLRQPLAARSYEDGDYHLYRMLEPCFLLSLFPFLRSLLACLLARAGGVLHVPHVCAMR